MAELNRDKPYDHAHGLVQDHEPFFFQDGFAFTSSGVEVFKDEMGNFSILSTSAKGKKVKIAKVEAQPEAATVEMADEAPVETPAEPAVADPVDDSI